MNKTQRICVFLAALAILALATCLFWSSISASGDKGIVILSALIMLSFTLLFAEHYFTRPTDVVASTTSVLLLISPMYESLNKTGVWYWILWGYCATLLLVSLFSLLLLDRDRLADSTQNLWSSRLKRFAVTFGNGRFIWFSVFVVTTVFYVDSQSPLFLFLMVYAAILMGLDPAKALPDLFGKRAEEGAAIGQLFGVQAGNAFLVRVNPGSTAIERYQVVGFDSGPTGNSVWKVGLVIDTYLLNDERWLKVLVDDDLGEIAALDSIPPGPIKSQEAYLLERNVDAEAFSRLVGSVCEETTIEKLRFSYAFMVPVQEGDLLEVMVGASKVLYQVVEGITGTERLEHKDESGSIIGEAVQLGIWNADLRRFERFGWVPMINAPVMKAGNIEPMNPAENEYQIGSVPGTNYPIFVDLRTVVTHHAAVLGVTGSGKSVFSRNLIRKIAGDGTKVICIDFTNEYRVHLADLIGGPLVSAADATPLFSAIDFISNEMDEFANKRDKAGIAAQEVILKNGFKNSIHQFVAGGQSAAIFELPDVSNSAAILDYTKWFFKALFELARANELGGNRVCVVLEEAHTIIPEWNFIGVDEKRSGAVVNSIAQIALQGRKYGVGFIVIAQRTANVSKTILTQCNSIVAFQQFDRTSADFLGSYMGKDYVSTLTRLRPRQAIAVGKAFSAGTPMIFQVPEIAE